MTDVDDHIEKYVDEPDEPIGGMDDAGGADSVYSPLLAHPDQSEYARVISDVVAAIRQGVEEERKFLASIGAIVRVTPNASGQISFARYTLAANQPIQIVREKQYRGDLVIVNFTDGVACYVGLHVGIMVAGSDTAAIVGSAVGTARRMRTKRALWAVASAPVTIDVQEEFD